MQRGLPELARHHDVREVAFEAHQRHLAPRELARDVGRQRAGREHGYVGQATQFRRNPFAQHDRQLGIANFALVAHLAEHDCVAQTRQPRGRVRARRAGLVRARSSCALATAWWIASRAAIARSAAFAPSATTGAWSAQARRNAGTARSVPLSASAPAAAARTAACVSSNAASSAPGTRGSSTCASASAARARTRNECESRSIDEQRRRILGERRRGSGDQ